MDIYKATRVLQKKAGLSNDQLAARLGVKSAHNYRYAHRRTGDMQLHTMRKLARGLGVKLSDLILEAEKYEDPRYQLTSKKIKDPFYPEEPAPLASFYRVEVEGKD